MTFYGEHPRAPNTAFREKMPWELFLPATTVPGRERGANGGVPPQQEGAQQKHLEEPRDSPRHEHCVGVCPQGARAPRLPLADLHLERALCPPQHGARPRPQKAPPSPVPSLRDGRFQGRLALGSQPGHLAHQLSNQPRINLHPQKTPSPYKRPRTTPMGWGWERVVWMRRRTRISRARRRVWC